MPFQKYKKQLKVEQIQKEQWNADLYPPGTCVLLGHSILNRIVEGNLSKEQTVKIINFQEPTVEDIQPHILQIIWKIPST